MAEPIVFDVPSRPTASILILAWRDAPYLLDCLRSLEASVKRVPYEVVLLLNEPSPELQAVIERQVRGAIVIRTRVNVGYGGAMNLAASRSRGEYLVLLNDDTEVRPNWLEALVETAERRPTSWAIGSTTVFPDGSIQEAGCVIWESGRTVKVGRDEPEGSRRYDFERRVDFCSGSSLLVRHAVWDELGGMDAERYFPAYYEDADLCLRIAEAGGEVWYQPRSLLMHRESMSTNNVLRNHLFARNREIFVDRWGPILAKRDVEVDATDTGFDRAVWHAMGSPMRLLAIDDQVADPAIGSGYPRTVEVFEELSASGKFHIEMFTSLVNGGQDNDAMARLGVQVLEGSFESDLAEHLERSDGEYRAVIISRPHNYERFAPIVREMLPGTPIIYDAEALFHRRIERQAALADEADRQALVNEADKMRSVEARIAGDADAVVSISEEEATFLRASARGQVVVNGPLLAGIAVTEAPFTRRSDIGFVAGWAGGPTSPNVDALSWFVREVFPAVLGRVPGARLLVTGVNPPAEVKRFELSSVLFVGNVDDLADLYDAVRVIVVPMRYGAGVKIKTIEALQHGVPTVATVVGAEGVPLDGHDALLVADDPEAFAIAVARLLDDPKAWELQRRRVVTQIGSWRRADRTWVELLDSVMAPQRVAAAR